MRISPKRIEPNPIQEINSTFIQYPNIQTIPPKIATIKPSRNLLSLPIRFSLHKRIDYFAFKSFPLRCNTPDVTTPYVTESWHEIIDCRERFLVDTRKWSTSQKR